MLPWAHFRRTYGAAIETRELVRRRLGRLAGLIVGCDALVAWCSWLLDQGYAFVTPTTHQGEPCTRFAIINPRTTVSDLTGILATMS